MDTTKKELKQAQKKLDARVSEIKLMSNKQLVYAFKAEAGWEYKATADMKRELAQNMRKDLELLNHEILQRMIPPARYITQYNERLDLTHD